MSQFPCHTVRGRYRIADLDPASSTIGIDAAEPEVVLARAVDQPLKSRRQILDLSAHGLSVSIGASKGGSGSIPTWGNPMHLTPSIRGPLSWTFSCAPRD